MTGSQMIESFLVHYDRISSFSAPEYTQEEILLFLNNAQNDFVTETVFGKNYQPPAFEDNDKRVVDILPLIAREIVSSSRISASTKYGNSWYCNRQDVLYNPYFDGSAVLYTIGIEALMTRSNPYVNNAYVPCKRIKTENVGKFITSGNINRPYFVHPVFIEESEGYYIIGDYYTTSILGLRASCIQRPTPITAATIDYVGAYGVGSMCIHPNAHQRIVDLAVRQALAPIQDPRYQMAVSENQIKTS